MLQLMANTRGRKHHKRRAGVHHRRRRSYRSNPRGGMGGGLGSIAGTILPIGLGVAGGLAIPKFLPMQSKPMQYLIQAGIGLGIPLIFGRLINRKSLVLFGGGVLASIIIDFLDTMFFRNQGKTLLADTADEVRVLTEEDSNAINDVGAEFNDEVGAEFNDEVGAEFNDEVNDEIL